MGANFYFSEREDGEQPRNEAEITQPFWEGFIGLVRQLIATGRLAERFPQYCSDPPYPICGCNEQALGNSFRGENPSILWPLEPNNVPLTKPGLDAVEFFWRLVSVPTDRTPHGYFSHEHLSNFMQLPAQGNYCEDVNRLFRRNRLPYEIQGNGQVQRIGPPVLRETLAGSMFQTGDDELNRLLENAREKFKSPDPKVRSESLEKLWDAWERLKTLYGDKKASIERLISEGIAEENLQTKITQEARELTDIGNTFQIRHFEKGKVPITEGEHIDYLFHRMFALIWLLLKRSGRLR